MLKTLFATAKCHMPWPLAVPNKSILFNPGCCIHASCIFIHIYIYITYVCIYIYTYILHPLLVPPPLSQMATSGGNKKPYRICIIGALRGAPRMLRGAVLDLRGGSSHVQFLSNGIDLLEPRNELTNSIMLTFYWGSVD